MAVEGKQLFWEHLLRPLSFLSLFLFTKVFQIFLQLNSCGWACIVCAVKTMDYMWPCYPPNQMFYLRDYRRAKETLLCLALSWTEIGGQNHCANYKLHRYQLPRRPKWKSAKRAHHNSSGQNSWLLSVQTFLTLFPIFLYYFHGFAFKYFLFYSVPS